MRKNFKKALFSIFTAILVLSMATTTSFAAVVNYGSEYKNQPTKSYSVTFKDVNKNYWAFGYIGEMVERGVLSGYPNGYFYPENTITRAEFSKIMCLAASLDVEPVDYTSYVDVDASEWYAPYVETGKYYLSGYVSDGNKYYMPEANALREDIAVALVKLKGYNTSLADESILKAMFTDYQSISSGARKYVAIAVENELISGYEDNTFRGQSSITRAEAATLLWRAYQYGNSNKVFEKEEFDEPAPSKNNNNKNDNKQTIKKEEPTDDDDDDDREVTKPTKPETKTNTEPKQEEYVEPVPEYTHEVKTIANGVTNLDRMINTDDGIAYTDLDAGRIYTVPADGKKAKCVLDVNELPYLGEDNLSKETLANMSGAIMGFGYNYYDSSLYAIISQRSNTTNAYLYNISDDEVSADISALYDNIRVGNAAIRMFFDANGNISFWRYGDRAWGRGDVIIDINNMKILDSECFTYNKHDFMYGKKSSYGPVIYDENTKEEIDFYIKGHPSYIGVGYNGCYFSESDNEEFYCVDSKGNEKFLFSVDDIDATDGKRFDINTIDTNVYDEHDETMNLTATKAYCTADASGNIYFWDSNYSCIRQISEK